MKRFPLDKNYAFLLAGQNISIIDFCDPLKTGVEQNKKKAVDWANYLKN